MGDTKRGPPYPEGENTDSQLRGGLALTLGTPLEIPLAPVVRLKKEGWLRVFDVFVLVPVRIEPSLRSFSVASALPG